MTRFILLEKPLVYPQVDIVNRAPEGPVFDLSVDLVNYDGPVYLRQDHVEEMARQLGWISPEQAAELINHKAELLEKLEQTPNPAFLREIKNGIDRYLSDLSGDDSGSSVVESDLPEGFDPISEKPAGAARQTNDTASK